MNNTLCSAAGDIQNSFVNAPDFIDRSLSLIVGYSKRDVSVRLGSSTAYSANREERQVRTMAASDGGGGGRGRL